MKKQKWEMSYDEFRKEYNQFYVQLRTEMDQAVLENGYSLNQMVNRKTSEELLNEDFLKYQEMKTIFAAA
jgi:hypothetical protein